MNRITKTIIIRSILAIFFLVVMFLTVPIFSGAKTITITCYGDSVTEGVKLDDFHSAVLGGSTYPSILYTLLCENGVDATVENEGHSGETTGAIVARLGGVNMFLNEELVFDNENYAGPIDRKITAVYSSSLQVPISFNVRHTDSNKIVIDGIQYNVKGKMMSDGNRKMFLFKGTDNTITTLKTGSAVQLSGMKRSNVSIILAGINDDKSIAIDDYVTMLKNGVAASSGKYIIVGPHSKIYDREGFVSGSTSEERRRNYQNKMIAEFGNHFVDLNTEWCERALPIAQSCGYLIDLSDEQINAIQAKLSSHSIPAEFTIDNKDKSVHLNRAGYTVIAHIVYERLKLLKYI